MSNPFVIGSLFRNRKQGNKKNKPPPPTSAYTSAHPRRNYLISPRPDESDQSFQDRVIDLYGYRGGSGSTRRRKPQSQKRRKPKSQKRRKPKSHRRRKPY